MSDLISRSALFADIKKIMPQGGTRGVFLGIVDAQSTIEAVPVVHGEWEKYGYKWKCSCCNRKINIDGTPKENGLYFCPNCGADMRKGGAE